MNIHSMGMRMGLGMSSLRSAAAAEEAEIQLNPDPDMNGTGDWVDAGNAWDFVDGEAVTTGVPGNLEIAPNIPIVARNYVARLVFDNPLSETLSFSVGGHAVYFTEDAGPVDVQIPFTVGVVSNQFLRVSSGGSAPESAAISVFSVVTAE